MKDFNKKITAESVYPEYKEEKFYQDGDVTYKTILNFDEAIQFSTNVASSCIGDDGEYIPEAYDYAIRSCVIGYYTNVELPENNDDRYALLYNTPLYKLTMSKINRQQFNAIKKSIDDRIDYTVKSNIKKFEEQLAQVVQILESVSKQSSAMFDGVDSETLNQFVKKVSDMKNLDEEKLVKAVTDISSANGGN